ncbi:response regulator [Alteromonas aestuariivivens]|uniref:Response regulator n=1 Tax=Alteromonas aestuariivivens TaxID=1938339 RepID=A0A3D8M4G8_9ALTE|nr:response regulator [Alteromonas aestuariivivens]RDV24508.1 response regulator [Alteromonas aestuariivivens]
MSDKIPAPTPKEDLNFLIIDNQGLVHDVIKTALAEIGIKRIASALNAYHALRLCETLQFDFVLLAFNVSHDKDGFHLYEELKHNRYITDKTTVIFLSAETSAELVNCIVELQPDDFWVKPLDRKRIEGRLNYLIDIRRKLNKLLHCLHVGDYSAAIYYAERKLKEKSVAEYHVRLRRIIGECLMHLRDYETAEKYYSRLLNNYDHAWVHIGRAKALLKQHKQEEADALIDELLTRRDTRFLTYDLLAQFFIEKEDFESAYAQMKEASRLAPRNIERNKRLWDLARLNHDKSGQLSAVQNMAKYAKNSIHDSPELTLNVIRSMLDLATSLNGAEAERITRRAESEIDGLVNRKGIGNQLADQVEVLKARIYCLRNDKKSAESIMKSKPPSTDGFTMEDNLDKMKAFHELGMKEHCLSILEKLRKQIAGDTFSSQVVDEYLKQESIERREISFTTNELKQMATVNFKEGRYVPAYNNLRQALTLAPKNKPVALNLLKVLVQIRRQGALGHEQQTIAQQAAMLLMDEDLPATQVQKRDEYLKLLGIELDATNDDAVKKQVNP